MAKASDNLFPYVHLVPAAAPSSPAAGAERIYLDSGDGNKLKRKNSSGTVTTIEGASGGGGTGITPRSGLIFGVQTPAAQTNWNTVSLTTAYRGLQGTRDSSGAQNAEITYELALAAGTYSLDLFHLTGTNRGIYTVYIDGTSVGTVDGYAASTSAAAATIASIVIATDKIVSVRLVMATKNGSSSSYVGSLNGLGMTRTGA